jgi:hypothetical protein
MNNNFIVFLDIDGVLTTISSLKKEMEIGYDSCICLFDERCVNHLNAFLKTTDSEIVLTSTWRLVYNKEELNNIFQSNGVLKIPIDQTKELGDRNLEIETYIAENEITEFIIFDDMELTCFPERFVKTDMKNGFTQEPLERAVKIYDL